VIPLPLATGFEVYLCVLLGLLAFLLLLDLMRESAEPVRRPGDEQLCFCRSCRYTFLVRRRGNLARCPRCGNLCRVRPRF